MARRRRQIKENVRRDSIAEEAAQCQRCSLYQHATKVVFGEGSIPATLMMIGEQPGDQEDREGRPFVGPAGRMLDAALQELKLDRRLIYLSNAVKHFKHELRGKRRLHKHPNHYEIEQCRWWLDQEFLLVRPKLVIALGAVAAAALMGRPVVLARERGRLLRLADGRQGFATIHPSAILRMPDEASRHDAFSRFVDDLRQAVVLADERTKDG
jgi:DNA polymerase